MTLKKWGDDNTDLMELTEHSAWHTVSLQWMLAIITTIIIQTQFPTWSSEIILLIY